MFINWAKNQLNIKIVYHGPGLSGKTTSLLRIYEQIPDKIKGDFVSLKTNEDRTIYFDYFQMEIGKIKEFTPCFQLYTVPGQKRYLASRKLILQGADGVVFVADSDPDRLEANVEMLSMLEQHMREFGLEPQSFPTVFQYNKRDLSNALSCDEMEEYLNPFNFPYFESIASAGVGVVTTFKAAVNLIVSSVSRKF
jgi:mutual gliding-motility protein MglA